VNHNGRQSRVPAVDSSTPASTLVDVSLSWRTRLGGSDALWFARLGNLGNERAYNATTNENVRRLSPLPARALSAGLRVGF
jgi:iron complex outermembrane receptor protein